VPAPAHSADDAAAAGTARAPSQAARAHQLATRVVRARTGAARYRALLDVMRAVRLGVYTKQGRAIVRGGERGRRDVYLYDFEVRAIATALARERTWSTSDLAGGFARVGLRRRGGPLTGDAVRRVLTAKSKSALARPRRAWSLVPLLVRELGRLQRPAYDLARGVTADRLRLDGLQVALLVADSTVPAARRAARRPAAVRSPQAAGVCGTFMGVPVVPVFGDFALNGSGSTSASALATLVSAAHGLLLGTVAVELRALGDGVARTHYGPAGHVPGSDEAGRRLRFSVLVTSWTAGGGVPCGALAGLALPAGPVRGAEVVWDTGSNEGLGRYGRVTPVPRGPLPGTGTTDGSGSATLEFHPNDEALPGLGRETVKVGVVQARVRFGAVPVHPVLRHAYDVAELLSVVFQWQVGLHEQHAFDASLTGRQQTSWTLVHRDNWTTPCGIDSDGSGSQTLTLGTPTPNRVVFYQDDAGAWQLRSPATRTIPPPLPFPLRADVARSGSIESRPASPEPCGGLAPRRLVAATDCGSTTTTLAGRLGFDAGAVSLTGLFTDPFGSCPVIGPGGNGLVPAQAALPLDQVANADVGRIDVTASASAPYDVSLVNTVRNGTSTIEDHAQNSIEWTLALDRVGPAPPAG
jgi:hypothetical protein